MTNKKRNKNLSNYYDRKILRKKLNGIRPDETRQTAKEADMLREKYKRGTWKYDESMESLEVL